MTAARLPRGERHAGLAVESKTMPDHDLVSAAVQMLRDNKTYIADARVGAPLGNSVVGSLLAIQWSAPRQQAELAVRMALEILDKEAKHASSEHTLPRTGQSPLRFQGVLLAECGGKWHAGQERNRWHNLAVYRTAGNQYVVAVGYRSCWQGELEHDTAEVVAEPKSVKVVLQEYQPGAHVLGFPDQEAYRDKQARLLADIRRRYESRVGAILDAPEFAECVA